MPAPKKYSEELRERATRLALESGRPIAHVARDLGVHKEALRTVGAPGQGRCGRRHADRAVERRARGAQAAAWRGPRAAAGQRDPQGRQRVFRQGARRDPAEVSALIESQKAAGFAVELICRTLGVSRSAHYQRASGRRSARAVADEQLVSVIRQVHEANFEAYGYRKLHLALRRRGIEVGRDRVKRLMRANGIQGAKRRGKRWKTTTPDAQAARRPDLVERDFTASRPDELYVADFTYLRCWEGLVFLAFVIDVYSRRVVGWQLASHMRASLVCDALRMAVCTRPRGADVALVHHSDRGSQGGFTRSSQHLEVRGGDGQAGWLDDGVDGPLGDEVTGQAVAPARGRAVVLA